MVLKSDKRLFSGKVTQILPSLADADAAGQSDRRVAKVCARFAEACRDLAFGTGAGSLLSGVWPLGLGFLAFACKARERDPREGESD
jgi:hypothetical protein